MRRVAVTGMGGLTPLGENWSDIRRAIAGGNSGIRYIEGWDHLEDLNTRLGGPILYFEHEKYYPRKKARSMGRVATLSVKAAENALEMAGLTGDSVLTSGRAGVAFGSSYGSTAPAHDFVRFIETGKAGGLTATSYIRMMSHTTAVNIGLFFGLRGRVITTSSACTSGSQGIGYAYESIAHGAADVMIAGGAEELCPTMAIVFDTLYATSTKNDNPASACRPFDRDRDGLIIGEGSAALVLEDYEHARARGATIFAEVAGYATNSDGAHVTAPAEETQQIVMRMALEDAGLSPGDIEMISCHGTATDNGDITEAVSTTEVFGDRVPLQGLKGHFGHTLGASGAIEAWLSIEMMRDNWFPPIANLDAVDPRCEGPDYIMGTPRELSVEHLVSNNFAFGGINTSLVFRRR